MKEVSVTLLLLIFRYFSLDSWLIDRYPNYPEDLRLFEANFGHFWVSAHVHDDYAHVHDLHPPSVDEQLHKRRKVFRFPERLQ